MQGGKIDGGGGPARLTPALLPALLVAGAIGLLFVVCAVRYAIAQSIWIDESTQLSGATLGIGRLIAWLAGAPEPQFGVPPDRMPPVSYLIDMACQRTLCGEDTSYRLLHLAFAGAGVAGVLLLAARHYGLVAAVAAGALLALSPRMIEAAVEIRAYPIFFAVTCAQLWVFYRLFAPGPIKAVTLAGFTALGILSEYTHFFGLVSTMALFIGLVAARVRDRRALALAAAGAAAALIAAIGLAPFVTGANSASDAVVARPGLGDVAAFLPRLILHPANLISLAAMALLFAGALALLAAGTWRAVGDTMRRPIAAPADPLVGLVVALAAGLTVTILSAYVLKGFYPLKPSYSIWTLPLLALVAAAGCAALRRPLDAIAAGIAAIGAGWGLAIFMGHAGWFIHGPGEAVAAVVGPHPAQTAVVYTDDQWAYGYFPLYKTYHDSLPQLLRTPDGQLHRLARGGAAEPATGDAAAPTADRLVAVAIKLENYGRLRALYRAPSAAPPAPAPAPAFAGWHQTGLRTEPGLYWTTIRTFERDR